jgi:predicted RNase H-like HicB family nuclease
MTTYRIVLIPEEEGGFSVLVPALPGCYTQGETRDEAKEMAREAIELHLESLRQNGDDIPADAAEIASVEVTVPAA